MEQISQAGSSPLEHSVRPQRLWIVRIVHEAYVLAKTEEEAKQQRREIERWEDFPDVTAEPWAGRLVAGWVDGCGVYGTKKSLSFGAAKKIDADA